MTPRVRQTTTGNGNGDAGQIRLDRPIVLVGLMGAGKSAIGRRLAHRLELPFHDSDDEIESAAGLPVPEIFARYGETAFRDVERKVILRLLDEGPQILATGGGAFMDQTIREAVARKGVSIWLRAPLSVLVERTARRNNRPLLANGDARETLRKLMDVRYPVYGAADITVESRNRPLDVMAGICLSALRRRLNADNQPSASPKPAGKPARARPLNVKPGNRAGKP